MGKTIYLTVEALRDLADILEANNKLSRTTQTAFITKTRLTLMDEGPYALDYQDVKVTLEFGPNDDGKCAPSEYDTYVIGIRANS